jgi:hypothetical protein
MKEETVIDPSSAARSAVLRRISWAAIFAGLTIALVTQLVLTILGISIGATALNPYTADQTTAQNFGIGAAVWLIVTSIISLFLGGWVAGRSSGFARGGEGSLHGFVTWGVSTLVTAFLLSAATSGLLSGTAGILKSALSAANQAAISATGNANQGGVGSALDGTGGGGADSVRQEVQKMAQGGPDLMAGVGRLIRQTPNVKPEDRQAVINILTSKNNMSQEQANQTVDRWVQTASQTKAQAEQKDREVGSTAALDVSTAGWASLIVLVLSGLAAAWGGAVGARAFLRSKPEIVVTKNTAAT